MKKLFKVLTRTLLEEESLKPVARNKDELSSDQKEQKITAETPASLSVASSSTVKRQDVRQLSKNNEAPKSVQSKNTQNITDKAAAVTTQSKKEAQAGQSQSSIQKQKKNRCGYRLFLGGLPDDIRETDLREVFEIYGKVIDVIIPIVKDMNRNKGYGFLEFEDELSAKACLGDHFVVVKGKKVEVKEAWPRGAPKEKRENLEKKVTKCGYEEKISIGLKDLENATDSCQGLSSDSESNMEVNQSVYQKLFYDYFSAKFALQNIFSSVTASDVGFGEGSKSFLDNEEEWAKIFTGFYISTEEESSVEGCNVNLSDDSDETDSSSDELEFDLKENDIDLIFKDRFNLTESGVYQNNRCTICKWTPLDRSTESLLAHYKTVGHKQKLKERFEKQEASDSAKNKTSTQIKTKNGNQVNKQRKNCMRNNKRKNAVNEPSKNQDEKSALQEIIASVEAKKGKWLKCKMCNKTIPHAPDFRVLMSNLSQHLQSKGHLTKIQKFESSLQKPKKVPQNKIAVKTNHVGQLKKTTPAGKVQKNLKNNQNNKNFANIK